MYTLVCIWCCEHARFYVAEFMGLTYIFLPSFLPSVMVDWALTTISALPFKVSLFSHFQHIDFAFINAGVVQHLSEINLCENDVGLDASLCGTVVLYC